MNEFGGDWTRLKIEILVEYAKAYLIIMNKYSYWRTLYFDGFAGTGFIINDKAKYPEITIGAARRIVEIDEPKSFDGYYFVEKDKENASLLIENTQKAFPKKKNQIFIAKEEDCNDKLKALADHLRKPTIERDYDKVLAYIDPCGMQLEWNSIQELRGNDIDIWILVPTGMGVNRLLKRNGDIRDAWVSRLERFLGLDEMKIRNYFFRQETEITLFGEEIKTTKKEKAIEKAANLYKDRLKDVFKFVAKPFPLKNERNSTMYHLIFASNNSSALGIAEDIIKKYS